MSRRAPTWPEAAGALARRVAWRDRLGAWLRPFGLALLAAAVLSVLAKVLGAPPPWPHGLLAAGAGVGLVAGAGRLGRVARVDLADAAWALDRLADARGRGLVAATVPGPVGAEAAWATGRLDPPTVRLLPPRGLAVALAGVLGVALALVAPAGAAPADAPPAPPDGAARTEAAGGGAVDDGEAVALEAAEAAQAAAAVREALGLGPQAAEDPARVAERLAHPEARRAAEEAADPGSALATLLDEGAPADEVAAALAEGARAEAQARDARRRAAAARADAGLLPVPAARRGLVERYFRRRSLRTAPSGEEWR